MPTKRAAKVLDSVTLRSLMRRHGFGVSALATFIGVNRFTVRRYLGSDAKMPRSFECAVLHACANPAEVRALMLRRRPAARVANMAFGERYQW